jgi:hypothetical protein
MLAKVTSTVVKGGFLLFGAGLLVESYQIPEGKMPETVLWLARAVFLGIIAVSLFALSHQYAYLPLLRWHQSRRYQWPAVDKMKPDPNQPLVDEAKRQAENQTTHLVITDRVVIREVRDGSRPFIGLRILYANLGINQILVSQLCGFPYWNDDRLPEPIHKINGRSRLVPGGNGALDVDVYFPADIARHVFDELDSQAGIRSLHLLQVTSDVQAEADGAKFVSWSLRGGTITEVFRRSR